MVFHVIVVVIFSKFIIGKVGVRSFFRTFRQHMIPAIGGTGTPGSYLSAITGYMTAWRACMLYGIFHTPCHILKDRKDLGAFLYEGYELMQFRMGIYIFFAFIFLPVIDIDPGPCRQVYHAVCLPWLTIGANRISLPNIYWSPRV